VIHAFPEIAMTAEQYLTNLKKWNTVRPFSFTC
jgi:hypothetical protein